MKKMYSSIKAFTALLLFVLSTSAYAQNKMVAYVPNWVDLNSFSNKIDYAKLTHINIAFENPTNAAGDLSFNSQNNILINKAHANNIKVLISIGGGSASGDQTLLARYATLTNNTNRAAFVAKLSAYVTAHNFDGLDVDLEGPNINGDYGAFIAALSGALKPKGKLLTSALSQGYGGDKVPNSVFQYFDFVNIMAYDGAGYWDPNAPGQHSSLAYAKSNTQYWLNRGLPKAKAVLGVPFYGYGFGNAFRSRDYPYNEIINSYPGAETKDQVGSTIWYNGIPTIKAKTNYAFDLGIGGMMIWSLDYDGTGAKSLLTAMDQVFKERSVVVPPVPQSPFNGVRINLPGKLEAENYDLGGQDVAYNDLTAGNEGNVYRTDGVDVQATTDAGGGYNLGWMEAGEWLEYSVNVTAAGTYNAEIRSASTAGAVRLEVDGIDATGSIALPNTGAYQTWATTTKAGLNLTAGQHILRIVVLTGGFNFNYINVVSAPSAPIKEYTINKTSTAITVDGVLSEAGWVNAPATANLLNMNGTAATQTANAKMLWSDTHLYFAFTIQDNSIWSTLTARDAQLYTQDVLEVLIDKDGDGLNYSEIGFAPNGTLYDLVMDKPYSAGGNANTAWNIANMQVKTTVTGSLNTTTGGVQWVVEAALPFAGIPATPASFGKPNAGDTWRLNFARADHNYNVAGSEKLYTWNYTDGVTNHLPSRFGKVTFGNAVGNQEPTVNLTSPVNNTSFTAPAAVAISASAADADGSISKVDFYNGTTLLSSDASSPYSYSWTNIAAGTYVLTAKATDNTGATVTSSAVSITVVPPAPVCLPASASSDDGNIPSNVLDNNVATRWSANGDGQWIEFCQGTATNISGVQIAFYSGNARQSIFDVQVSQDKSSWINVLTNVRSSGTSVALETFAFAPQSAKYVRLVGHGNTVNTWNSYTEVKLLTGVPPVNQSPFALITSPANNASYNVPGSITITASATDVDGSVSKVDFFNGTTLLGSDNTAPYSYTWSAVAVGSYSIAVVATDNQNATTTSEAISITVLTAPVNLTPTITLTAPANNSSVDAPASIGITATAADTDGTVSKVEFYNGTTLLGTDNSSPYSYTWTNVAAGTYAISAKVTDNSGATATSATATVKVNTVVLNNPCSGLATYKENGGYAAGTKVQNAGKQYQCKPYPYSGWCNGSGWAYAPGVGSYWTDAWTLIGSCTATREANESSQASAAMITNAPNPFVSSTDIQIEVTEAGEVSVLVYNKSGQVVGTLVEGYLAAGTHTFTFDASNLKADLYLVKYHSASGVATQKMMKVQ